MYYKSKLRTVLAMPAALAACAALLVGCGGGGSLEPTSSTLSTVSGQVTSTDSQLSASRESAQFHLAGFDSQPSVQHIALSSQPVRGATVTLGRVDSTARNFTAIPGASAVTGPDGRFTITLPAGIRPAADVVARVTDRPVVLQSIVTGPQVNISPETTGAADVLYASARDRGLGVSRLTLTDVAVFLQRALEVVASTPASPNALQAIADARATIQNNTQASTALAAAIERAGGGTSNIPAAGQPTTRPTPLPFPTARPNVGSQPIIDRIRQTVPLTVA